MTPKKIYIEKALKFTPDSKQRYYVTEKEYSDSTPYILESEHNRLVEELKKELSTSNDLLKMTSDISEYRLTQVTELKKHLQILLSSIDGELDAKRIEYGWIDESEYSIKAKKYLQSII